MRPCAAYPQEGGKVVASGGYGCVFSPAVQCGKIISTTGPHQGQTAAQIATMRYISKVLLKKDAIEEYDFIKELKQDFKSIPNYYNYFLLDNINLCQPVRFTPSDLENFNSKCSTLKKKAISPNNINAPGKLDKLLVLQMPHGGITIDDYIINHAFYSRGKYPINLTIINTNLINLLNNGIVKMNQMNYIHGDIKTSNMLIGLKDHYTRLIDWGFLIYYDPSSSNISERRFGINEYRTRRVMFNAPLSCIIFNDEFEEHVNKYDVSATAASARMYGANIEQNVIKSFVHAFVTDYMAGERHFSIINSTINEIYQITRHIKKERAYNSKWVQNNMTYHTVVNYIYTVVKHFEIVTIAPDGAKLLFHKSAMVNYLNKVYRHIVDICGFLTIYSFLLDMFFNNYKNLNSNEIKLFLQVKKIFIEFYYTPHLQPMNIDKLSDELRKLNSLWDNINFVHNVPSNQTLSSYLVYVSNKRSAKEQKEAAVAAADA